MSLWGTSDSLYSTGTVSVNLTTKVATFGGATLPAASVIEGAVITITGKGSAVIKERTGNTTAVLIIQLVLTEPPSVALLTTSLSNQFM